MAVVLPFVVLLAPAAPKEEDGVLEVAGDVAVPPVLEADLLLPVAVPPDQAGVQADPAVASTQRQPRLTVTSSGGRETSEGTLGHAGGQEHFSCLLVPTASHQNSHFSILSLILCLMRRTRKGRSC